MSLIKEFKAFALRGNMVDLAIGVIIGIAFGKVVSSLVSDVIMPPLGLLVGGIDFSSHGITLKEATATQGAIVLKYGVFLNAVVDFLIIAVVIFFVIKAMNRLSGQKPPKAPSTIECPECLMVIPKGAKKCCHCCSSFK
jgi:large conductance mechanosensitive channel